MHRSATTHIQIDNEEKEKKTKKEKKRKRKRKNNLIIKKGIILLYRLRASLTQPHSLIKKIYLRKYTLKGEILTCQSDDVAYRRNVDDHIPTKFIIP